MSALGLGSRIIYQSLMVGATWWIWAHCPSHHSKTPGCTGISLELDALGTTCSSICIRGCLERRAPESQGGAALPLAWLLTPGLILYTWSQTTASALQLSVSTTAAQLEGPGCWQNGRMSDSRTSHGQNLDVICLTLNISLPFLHPHQ